MTAKNVELKAKCENLDRATGTARSLGADDADQLVQVDTYFDCADGRLKLREISSRESGSSAELIWYTRPDNQAARTSHYHVVHVPCPDAVRTSLGTGLGIRVVIRKTRHLWLWHNVRIHLDTVQQLGDFLEFEAVLEAGQDETDGYRQLEELCEAFAVAPDDIIGESYSDLLGPSTE